MYQVSVATLTSVAIPYWASVLAPVLAVPPSRNVTPPDGLIVVAEDAMINTAVPIDNATAALVGMVMVPEP